MMKDVTCFIAQTLLSYFLVTLTTDPKEPLPRSSRIEKSSIGISRNNNIQLTYIVLYQLDNSLFKMNTTTIIKIILMVVFFTEVIVFGRFISNLKCFKSGKVMSIAMTFSGMLFLSIALLDIIPQAIANFDIYFDAASRHVTSSSSLHSNSNLPLTMIIAMFTFLIIMYIDKIMIGHSHDHEYEVSFTNEPKKSIRQINYDIKDEQRIQNNIISIGTPSLQTEHKSQQLNQEAPELSLRPFILQAGMSIHSFFECLAVGIQPTTIGVLGLASAIIVHKWAEGLTLGLIYRKQGYQKTLVNIMIIVQGLINVAGLIVGTIILGQGHFLMAFFMSISAGTFLYISLCQVLIQQVNEMTPIKAIAMVIANVFMIFLVWFQKFSESTTQT